MAKELWLPNGYELADGSKVRSLLFSGDDWHILGTSGSKSILLATTELAQKWNAAGFIEESLLDIVLFGTKSYLSLSSHKKHALIPVEKGGSPASKVDALAFSIALKETRKISKEASFHDAIYVEQYSRLLPTWTLTPHVEDEVVLGTWITGGVVISTDSFRRLTHLTGWMPAEDLSEIITAAGLYVPADVGLYSRTKPKLPFETEDHPARGSEVNEVGSTKSLTDEAEHIRFTLPGRPRLEEFFNEHVIDIIFNASKYRAMSIEFPSAIVLHGPPGCGKTFAVERLVEFLDWPNYSIDSNSVGSPYIHQTSKMISEVFEKAMDNAPAVIVIDEMESFLSDRRTGAASGLLHVEEVSEFLRRIPEANKNKVLVVAMTNMIDLIDPAILRRGRFDHIIEVGMPSRVEVASLLDSLLSKLPKAEDLNMDVILEALTGKALSDSAFVVREAARLAAKNGKSHIDQESIDNALKSLPEEKGRTIGFTGNS